MKKRVLLSLVAIISIFSLQSCVTNYVVSTPTKYKSSTKLDKINTFELDPIEVLKKRKNLKILKVLNLMLTLNLDKTIKKDDIESYNEYKDKFLENIATIGLDRLEQEALKVQIENLLKYNWVS